MCWFCSRTRVRLSCFGISIENMRAIGAAGLIQFALWRHLICPHTAFASGIRFCPAPIRENIFLCLRLGPSLVSSDLTHLVRSCTYRASLLRSHTFSLYSSPLEAANIYNILLAKHTRHTYRLSSTVLLQNGTSSYFTCISRPHAHLAASKLPNAAHIK